MHCLTTKSLRRRIRPSEQHRWQVVQTKSLGRSSTHPYRSTQNRCQTKNRVVRDRLVGHLARRHPVRSQQAAHRRPTFVRVRRNSDWHLSHCHRSTTGRYCSRHRNRSSSSRPIDRSSSHPSPHPTNRSNLPKTGWTDRTAPRCRSRLSTKRRTRCRTRTPFQARCR